MTLPTHVANGASSGSTSSITPALPAGIAVDDILFLFIESRSNQFPSMSDAGGGTWNALDTQNVGGTGATTLTIYWSRYNGTQTAPTIADSGDHTFAFIAAFRGCSTSDPPYEGDTGTTDATSNTSVSIPGSTTTGVDRLVVGAASRDQDDAAALYSSWANADLANIDEIFNAGTTQGNGGGLGVITGEKASAGSYGSTSASLATPSSDAVITFALIPLPPSLDQVLPDADIVTTGWSTAPLFSKINDGSDASVITATAS